MRSSGTDRRVGSELEVELVLHRRFLGPTGASLSFACNGAEAVEQAAEARFDVILMDIQMPRLDGVAAALAIREAEARHGPGRTAIVAVTANVLTHQTDEYRASGMDEVLAKPVSKRALLALLRRLTRVGRAA